MSWTPSLLVESICTLLYFLSTFCSEVVLTVVRYRGAAPIYHTLLNNDKETGVTVLELSKNKFDAGKILKQVKYVSRVQISVYRVDNRSAHTIPSTTGQLGRTWGQNCTINT
jgi:hypothetical protein